MSMVKEMKEISVRLGMSQQAVAGELGVAIQTVNRWYTGKRKPHKFMMEKINKFVKRHCDDKPVD